VVGSHRLCRNVLGAVVLNQLVYHHRV
jgi:hypothetical protein